MQTSCEFPVEYTISSPVVQPLSISVLATHAAANSSSELGKCEVVFYNKQTRKICVNQPLRLLFDSLSDALPYCARFASLVPRGICLAIIYYEEDTDEIYKSSLCVGNSLAKLM